MPVPLEKARVLIVDDEKVIADTLARIFINSGYQARAVYSAEDALQVVAEFVPQLAIVDVHLPGMQGADLAVRLQAEYPECRITLFSGQTATGDLLTEAENAGHSFEVHTKPMHPTEILGIAARLLQN